MPHSNPSKAEVEAYVASAFAKEFTTITEVARVRRAAATHFTDLYAPPEWDGELPPRGTTQEERAAYQRAAISRKQAQDRRFEWHERVERQAGRAIEAMVAAGKLVKYSRGQHFPNVDSGDKRHVSNPMVGTPEAAAAASESVEAQTQDRRDQRARIVAAVERAEQAGLNVWVSEGGWAAGRPDHVPSIRIDVESLEKLLAEWPGP
jgi:hypothetical protein